MSHVWPPEQSPSPLQPHAPEMQTWPARLSLQLVQESPAAPHASVAVPDTQVPDEQQPPLHGSLIPQLLEHVCVSGLQAVPVGQSLTERHPHFEPLDVPEATHAVPEELELQSRQVPLEPHEVGVLPGSHVPPAPQQLPVQVVPPLPQVTSQTPLLHDAVSGQSVRASVQPH